jgi:tetratricopeptide (TPR) repeat protein
MRAVVLVGLCARMAAFGNSVLVLPFLNATGNSNLEWIGESLAEAVREALASEGILAVSREDRQEAYKRLTVRAHTQLTKATIIRLAETLDAQQVIYGSFTFTAPAQGESRTRGTLRVTAQSIDLSKASRGPDYNEAGPLDELARLQGRLAWQTLRVLIPDKAPTEDEFRSKRPALRVGAIEHYVRGLLAPEGDQKLKLFQQAVRIDPAFSQAHFQIGRLQWEKKNYRTASEHLQRVAPADVRYREAHFVLGLCRFHLSDFKGAQQAFQGVAAAVPLNEVWNNLGAAQSRLNLPEALVNFEKALDGDPADPDYHFNVGYALFRSGEFEKAAERFRAVLDRDPEDAEATIMLGRCLQTPRPRRAQSPADEGLERVKENFEESAYLQLKAVLEPKR